MKKILTIIFLLLITLSIKNVHAANYELKELIPLNKETTIVTDNFSYKGITYKNTSKPATIEFKAIKNISQENIPISISVGLFDKKKKNIGIVNYCSTYDQKSFVKDKGLDSKEEISYVIDIEKKYLATNKSTKDIKYFSILSDNISCKTKGSKDYIGARVEEIGVIKNNPIDSSAKLLINIAEIIVIFIFLLFLYKFLFTNSFRNFNGEDVRQEYEYLNKQLKEERANKPPQTIKKSPSKSNKSEKIKKQEADAKEKSSEDTSLHNLYK